MQIGDRARQMRIGGQGCQIQIEVEDQSWGQSQGRGNTNKPSKYAYFTLCLK